jgi:CHAD domain-containing protein
MVTELREIEWKYDAAPGSALPDLAGLPRVAVQTEPEDETLEAVYHDTAAFDLARAGITLRHRSGGGDAGWHLKLPVRPGVRTELRLPPGGELPDEFRDLLTARVRGRPLRPVAHITTRRLRRCLQDRDGASLAEVVVDAVTAETFGETTVLTRWGEVEVELAAGAADGRRLLEAADRRLRKGGLRRSRHASKLQQALGALLPAAAPEPGAGSASSAGEALVAYLRAQIEDLTAWDLLVRRDEPDSVHQMRVTCRRLRSALQGFGPLVRRTEALALIGELRWLGEELGHARDDEVLGEHMAAALLGVPAELVLGPVQARIAGHFAPQQAASRHALLEALRSERYLALLDRLDALLTNPAFTTRAERSATKELPRLVRRTFRRVSRRMSDAAHASTGPTRDVALHEARKSAKRARYAAEAVTPVIGRKARRSAKDLKALQSELGEHQDAVIAGEALRQLALRAHAEQENTFTYGLLHQREADQAERWQHRAVHAWNHANHPKRTAWMG